jgi:hypothetical protein
MKRIFLIAALFCTSLIVLQSCSPKTTNSAVALKKGNVTGNWVINDITFDGIPEAAVRSFLGETSYKCFVGSTWSLTNSGNGSYSLPASSTCGAYTQNIFWSVSTADETFQFKKLNEKDKAKNITDGYRMMLSSTDGSMMTIKSPIEYGNRTAYIVLHFVKAVK